MVGVLKKGAVLFVLLIAIAITTQSCGCEDLRIVGEGTASIRTLSENSTTDTIEGEFEIQIHLETELAALEPLFQFIPSAYATSPCYRFADKPNLDALELKVNRSFEFDGNTIEAGSNFANSAGLDSYSIDEEGIIIIQFSSAFLDKAVFEDGEHTFNIDFETEEGEEFAYLVAAILTL